MRQMHFPHKDAELWLETVGNMIRITVQTEHATQRVILSRDEAVELYGALDVLIDSLDEIGRTLN